MTTYNVTPDLYPVKVAWSKFAHEPYKIGVPVGGNRNGAFKASTMRPMGLGREFGLYRIHGARYSLATDINQVRIRQRGQPVVATLDGETVGACNGGFLWVHESHRDTGLAIEMLIELFLIVGPERWCAPPALRAGRKMIYSREGAECFKRVFRELVKRGVIEPIGEMPT